MFETLDGKKFRALLPWMNTTNLGVPKHKVESLLQYILKPKQGDSRIAAYQNMCVKNASANMFLPRAMPTDVFETEAKSNNLQLIRNDIRLRIYNFINDVIIEEEYDEGKQITSSTDINNIIHDKRIGDLFSSLILDSFGKAVKGTTGNPFSGGRFPFSEALSSFIGQLKNLKVRFIQKGQSFETELKSQLARPQ